MDDGLPEAMVESIDVGRTEELSVNPEVSCCRTELSVNPEGTVSRGRTEELELGFRIAATEELELGSAGTGIMALLGVVLIVAAVPLVGTTLLTSVPTGTGVGAGRRGARRRSRWNPDPRASAQDCCPGPG